MTTLQNIEIAPPLSIRYLSGRSHNLVVCFSGVGKKRHEEPPPEFYKISSNNGENHVLFISDTNRSWLNTPGMAETIVGAIQQISTQIQADRITAIGNSMGGTMALHLSKMVHFNNVIAIVPQYSVDPELVPEEIRWIHFRKRISHYIFRSLDTLPENETLYFILHGGSDDEWVHVQHFPKGPNITHFIYPKLDHDLAKILRRTGELKKLFKHGSNSRRWRFRQIIEASGGLIRYQFQALKTANKAKTHHIK